MSKLVEAASNEKRHSYTQQQLKQAAHNYGGPVSDFTLFDENVNMLNRQISQNK
jgi:hypothetical protein